MLQHLRDEAHRFAVTYHRQKREKRALASPLGDVYQIRAGSEKRSARRSGRLARPAPPGGAGVAETPGIGPELAAAIFERLHAVEPVAGALMTGPRSLSDRRARRMTAEVVPVEEEPGTLSEEPPAVPGFLSITGLSGAGRSEAAHSLEDLGYFVVDNLPPALLSTMAELVSRPGARRRSRSWSMRGGVFFDGSPKALDGLQQLQVDYRILFLEAADEDLVNRYERPAAGIRWRPPTGWSRASGRSGS